LNGSISLNSIIKKTAEKGKENQRKEKTGEEKEKEENKEN